MISKIIQDLVESVKGAYSAIFMDGDGEEIGKFGSGQRDIKVLGAWKEIQLDHIREITGKLGLGGVNAVLFSLDEGNALIAPVSEGYSLLLFMSSFADLSDAMSKLKNAVELLRKEIE